MDVKVFQYFEAVCRNRSLPRAAAELEISTQGLSSSMARLTRDIGAPLLVTINGIAEPTPYGNAVLRCATKVNDTVSEMRLEVAALLSHDQNVIRMGAITGALGYLGEDLVDKFNASSLGAQALIVCESTNAEVLRALRTGECDVAILAEKPDASIHSTELVRDSYFLWVNKKNRLSHATSLSMQDLSGQTLAIFDLEPDLTDPIALEAARHGVTTRCVGEIIRVFELAHDNRAVGLTCRNHVEATRGTNVVGIPFDMFDMTYYLSYRQELTNMSAVIPFLQFVAAKKKTYGRNIR